MFEPNPSEPEEYKFQPKENYEQRFDVADASDRGPEWSECVKDCLFRISNGEIDPDMVGNRMEYCRCVCDAEFDIE